LAGRFLVFERLLTRKSFVCSWPTAAGFGPDPLNLGLMAVSLKRWWTAIDPELTVPCAALLNADCPTHEPSLTR
jgi:hypothetical protein